MSQFSLRRPVRGFGLTTLVVSLLASFGAWAGGHKTPIPRVDVEVDPEVEAAVTAVVHGTAERWNSQDYGRVLEMWDKNEKYPFYLAEEQAGWFVGWDQVNAYLDPPTPSPFVEAIRLDMRDVQVKQIAPDLAIAIWYMHFEMKTRGSNPIGEDVRASGVFRNTDEGWRFIHYAESPKTAMVYIEDLFEKDVEPGWDEYFEGAQKRKQAVWEASQSAD